MLDIAAKLEAILNDETNWEEIDPALGDEDEAYDPSLIYFRFDEFDPRCPSIQVVLENMPEKKTWVSDVLYRIEHKVKITIFLKPVRYDETTIAANKTTFFNAREQIDKILATKKFLVEGVAILELNSGWNDGDSITVGRDSGFKPTNEPIIFKSEQIVTAIYYSTSFLLPDPYMGGIPLPTPDAQKYGNAVRWYIVKDDEYYYAITDQGTVTRNVDCTTLVNSVCETIFNSPLMYGFIYFNCDATLASSILYRDGITFIGAMPMGVAEETAYKYQLTYTGDNWAIKSKDDDTWRNVAIKNLCIKNTNVAAKGMIALVKTDQATIDDLKVMGYATEAAIRLDKSSLKGNIKKLTGISIEGELHIAVGIDVQSDWAWIEDLTVSKTTDAVVRIGDQAESDAPYHTTIRNAHAYNCQHRCLDVQWAKYLLVDHFIDEHDANWVGTKESSWYVAGVKQALVKNCAMLNCNADYDVGANHPPSPYMEYIDDSGTMLFMRNDAISDSGLTSGLRIVPRLIVDDFDRGSADTVFIKGKTTDLLRLKNSSSGGHEITFALDSTVLKLWNVTNSNAVLTIKYNGSLSQHLYPDEDNKWSIGYDDYRWAFVRAFSGRFDKLDVMSGASQGVVNSFVPYADNTYDLGSETKTWANLYVEKLLVATALLPISDNAISLGSETYRWSWVRAVDCKFDTMVIVTTLNAATADVDVKLLKINGTEVISAARLLHNVDMSANMLSEGTVPDARLSGATESVTVRNAAGDGTTTLYFENGLYKYKVG